MPKTTAKRRRDPELCVWSWAMGTSYAITLTYAHVFMNQYDAEAGPGQWHRTQNAYVPSNDCWTRTHSARVNHTWNYFLPGPPS
ncbi:hypothetical protein BAU01nite_04420 [Brevibacterium aurantiacum]|nr:hypothetical protein BAU01nite_04420 [Brevibacterium aurantiacum]